MSYKDSLGKGFIPISEIRNSCYWNCFPRTKTTEAYYSNGIVIYLCKECANATGAEHVTADNINEIIESNNYINVKYDLLKMLKWTTADKIQIALNEIVIEDVIR